MMMKRLTCLLALAVAVPVFAGSLIVTEEAPGSRPATSGAFPTSGVAPVVITPVAPIPAAKVWEVRQADINLANAFTRWAKEAGYRVRWDARKNSMIEGPDQIAGSFEDAITYVLSGPSISESTYPLEVCFYPNTPPLARITRKGEQDKECK